MPAEKDNYRELANSPHSWHSDNDQSGDCEICKRNVAIVALVEERDALTNECERWDKVAGNMHEKTVTLARENERLRRDALALADKLDLIVASPEYLSVFTIAMVHGATYCGPTFEKELITLRAALANAPTPSDKGK